MIKSSNHKRGCQVGAGDGVGKDRLQTTPGRHSCCSCRSSVFNISKARCLRRWCCEWWEAEDQSLKLGMGYGPVLVGMVRVSLLLFEYSVLGKHGGYTA